MFFLNIEVEVFDLHFLRQQVHSQGILRNFQKLYNVFFKRIVSYGRFFKIWFLRLYFQHHTWQSNKMFLLIVISI